jgi:glucose/arabinose dehydrogenase/cell division septation protein DedD
MKSNKKILLLSLLLRWVSDFRRKTPVFRMLFLVVLIFSLGNATLFAQLPTGFIAKKITTNNIRECVAMAHAPDGRIFIAERGGILKQLMGETVTTVHTVATTTDSEQGLLGIALHSNFAQNGKCYLYYTNPTRTFHYLDVITLNAQSQVTSNVRLMQFDPILNGYHNGGAMVFKGNYLYICIGESNQQATAQDLNTYMGKVLRLQDDGQPAPGNPYYNTAGASRQQRSIWAIGMRNPWYMSMDPQSQKLYVINVGGGYEEIDDVTAPDASKNYDYGWGASNRSGPDQFNTTIYPIFAYNRAVAGWNSATCAITGGLAFNPTNTNYPAQYRNKFYFTDWCTGWMRSLDMNNPSGGWQEFFPSGFDRILGLSTGIDGNIYYSEFAGQGNIWRLEYTLAQTPLVVNHPLSKTLYAGDNTTFSVTVSGTAPFSYQWKRNGVNIPGATASSYSLTPAAQSDAGTYSVRVTNAFGEVESNGAVLTVNPFNAIPVVDISSPATSLTWAVGEPVAYSANATDAEDGEMPASSFQWEVQLFHKDCPTCEHWHPGPSIISGVKSGTFTADNGGETSSNIWLRVFLRVTDSQGRTGIDSVDIQPKKVNITVQSNKPGLEVVIGSESVTPYTKSMVINTAATMVAVSPQLVGDSVFTFSSWNHGGNSSQDFRVPSVNTTYRANFTSSYNTNINIALNKPATASTSLGGNVANSATDGNAASRWESQFADPQWIYVDLGARFSITRVRLVWEDARGKDFQIFISDDPNNWGTPVKVVNNNSSLINNLTDATGTGRYVRMYGTARVTGYGYSLYEFEVYGVPFGGSTNQNPTAVLTAPLNNATFAAPANITLTATASDADGSVSKVEFYNGATKLGEDLTAPYSFVWNNVAVGTYAVTARAIDNQNGSGTSVVSTITVSGGVEANLALSKPAFSSSNEYAAVGPQYAVDGNVTGTRWSSQFSDPQWFYVDLGATYQVNRVRILWEAARGRDYQIFISNDINNWGTPVKTVTGNTALENNLTDASGTGRYVRFYGTARTTPYGFSMFEFQVYGTLAGGNVAPTTSITAPANNSAFPAPANFTLSAAAADSDGSVTLVEFYNNGTKIGEDATAPYSLSLTNVIAGVYAYTSRATDNSGASTTSAAVSITVTSNALPTVSLTAPANNAAYTAPANITLSVTAADANGSVTLVEFFSNGTKVGEDASAPYSLSLTNIAAGAYSFTARATDNQGATATSAVIAITITNPSGGTNLALNKPAFSSTNENAANGPQYAVDGNATGTRWSSQFADPQWFYVDLGATYNINRVRIVFEAARGRDYQIFISNDVNNWGTPVKTVTGNTALVNDLTDVTGSGRYVRFYGTARATVYGFSFFEFEVYGTSPLKLALQNTSVESASDELAIYPNPFTDEITLKARFQEAGFVNVILTDQNGNVVYDQDFENSQTVFETKIGFANLSAGVYTMKLFSGKEVFSGRLIKQ